MDSIEAILKNELGEKVGTVIYSKSHDYMKQMAVDFIVHKEMEAEFLRYTDKHPLMAILREDYKKSD